MSSLQKVFIDLKTNQCPKNTYVNSVPLPLGFETLGIHLLKHWRIEIQCWIYTRILGLLCDCPSVPSYILNRSSPCPKPILLLISAQAPSCSVFCCSHTTPFSSPPPRSLSFPTGSNASVTAL